MGKPGGSIGVQVGNQCVKCGSFTWNHATGFITQHADAQLLSCLDALASLHNQYHSGEQSMTRKLILSLSLLFAGNAHAQGLIENLTDEFKGRTVKFVYTNEIGEVVTENYVTKFGIFNKAAEVSPIFGPEEGDPGTIIDDIPTAGLAAEHWWLSFELLMKGQREYAACVAGIRENQMRIRHKYPPEQWSTQGVSCLIDDPCSSLYQLILTIREYWVPFGIVENFTEQKPPTVESYRAHFAAGISGLNQVIEHRDLCRQGLELWRQIN